MYQFFHVCTRLLTGLDSILNQENHITLYTVDALALLSFAQMSLVKTQSWLNPALFLLHDLGIIIIPASLYCYGA